ncbi:hypothetical protein CDAR_218381 [Caerostris darwini]|uniref:Uncharacterized protein n=1 Tax=Caerostris darwini TaxID=1538125 RepID=A0AAV4Q814_9ARAC|nr:hypothetical protein CDAR_259861 [Caerostris darwini]GIY17273.1 hypothetical protein CDAR_218381 [Caerostris darwini]
MTKRCDPMQFHFVCLREGRGGDSICAQGILRPSVCDGNSRKPPPLPTPSMQQTINRHIRIFHLDLGIRKRDAANTVMRGCIQCNFAKMNILSCMLYELGAIDHKKNDKLNRRNTKIKKYILV